MRAWGQDGRDSGLRGQAVKGKERDGDGEGDGGGIMSLSEIDATVQISVTLLTPP